MNNKLKFPTAGFAQPVLGAMPLMRYAEWILDNIKQLHQSGKLDEYRKRDFQETDGVPFSFKPSAQ